MAQSDVMMQAKAGNPAAIATLLNRNLQAKGMTVTTRLDDTCLTIELLSDQPIPQASAIAYLQQGMKRLQPEGIATVFVCAATAPGALSWMESFLLDGTIPPAMNAAAEPDLEASLTSKSSPLQRPVPMTQADLTADVLATRSRSTPHPPPPVAAKLDAQQRPPAISAKGVEALLIGLVAAIVLFCVGFLKVLFYGAVILVHEVGHAVAHWAFGRPAIPTVNILYGGGITLTFGQVWVLNVLIYLGIGYLIYRLRRYPRWQGIAVGLTLVYTYCLFTPTNRMLSVLMGHGMELIAIAVCLYLSATGKLCRIPGDRAIYAMLGSFIFLVSTEFYWKLLHDPEFREWYEGGIGGVLDNDLVILANEYFYVDLSRIAGVLLVACLLTPAIAVLACYINSLRRFLRQLLPL